ncbi:hypothetical protein SDC9_54989 [bioreactor metagenome]|uniref:Uncharacterized protein n=1 Tax=bioreactor metagenome TaxID=1076179 RepID=A0A644WXN5_9ZZZZ
MFLLSLTLCLIVRFKKKNILPTLAFPFLLLIFYNGSLIMFAYYRGGFLPDQPGVIRLVSQYSHLSIGLSCGFYLLTYQSLYIFYVTRNPQGLAIQISGALMICAIFVILFINSCSKLDTNVYPVSMLHTACGFTVQNYEQVPKKIRAAYVSPKDESAEVLWLQAQRFSLFGAERIYSYPYEDDMFLIPVEDPQRGFPLCRSPKRCG